MAEQIIDLGKQYFYFVLIAVGLLVVVGSILDWKWISRINSPTTLSTIRIWIEKTQGVEARYRFERWAMGVCGVVLIGVGFVYWWFVG